MVDALMESRWREELPPFDGVILLSRSLRLDELRAEVSEVVAMLPRSANLSTFHDWHEHDGYVAPAKEEPWASLEEAVSDATQFVGWSSDDTFVRRAWYPPDFAFLLRWCVTSLPDDFGLPPGGPGGQFDVTASHELVERLSAVVPEGEIRPAKEYFDASWAG
jgi:hypothetical protein